MQYHHPIQKQSGAILMVGLLILVVLTIIGISAINSSILGEKITGNQRDKDLSFQAAESRHQQT